LLASYNFTSGWTNVATGSPVDADTFSSTGTGGIYKNVFTAGQLIKQSITTDNAALCSYRLVQAGYASVPGVAYLSSGSQYSTIVATYTYAYLRNASASTSNVSVLKGEQVLTPSTTGFTFGTLQAGSLNPNAASFTLTVTRQ
jgi:hypothetical protein